MARSGVGSWTARRRLGAESKEPNPPTPFPEKEGGVRVLSSPPSFSGKGVGGLGFFKLFPNSTLTLGRNAFGSFHRIGPPPWLKKPPHSPFVQAGITCTSVVV